MTSQCILSLLLETDGTREPLLRNMNSNLFTLDFASGTDNVIGVSSYDNVGNQMIDGPRLNLHIPKGISARFLASSL